MKKHFVAAVLLFFVITFSMACSSKTNDTVSDVKPKESNQEVIATPTTIPTVTAVAMEELNEGKEEDHNLMIENSLISTGNNYRIKKVMERAQKGEEITVAFIGGSITEGAGATANQGCYAYQTYEFFKKTYGNGDGSNIKYVNAGMGGTPSALGIIRYDRDVTSNGQVEPDIVFIEFAVNDYQEPTNGEAYESLIRKVLSAKNNPAVVLVFSVFKSKWNMQDLYIPVGSYYELPMISVKDAVVPELDNGSITEEEFFADEFHPTDFGHDVMTDCILNYFKKVQEETIAEKPFDIPGSPMIGGAFEHIQMIDSNTVDNNVTITPGSFNTTDSQLCMVYGLNRLSFPQNWKRTASSGAESFLMDIECKNLLFVYKSSSSDEFGAADIYIDGKLVATADSKQGGGWNNPITLMLLKEENSGKHKVEIKMSEGSEEKEFSILAFGYTK